MPGTKFKSDLVDKGYKWDTPLEQEDAERWRTIYKEIQMSTGLKIPRYHKFDLDKPVRLQVFNDASIEWGGCVAYLSQNGKAVVVTSKIPKVVVPRTA